MRVNLYLDLINLRFTTPTLWKQTKSLHFNELLYTNHQSWHKELCNIVLITVFNYCSPETWTGISVLVCLEIIYHT